MPWLAPAPFLFGHEDKNEDDSHAQENQRPDPPRRVFDATRAMGQCLRNQHLDLPLAVRRGDFMDRLACKAVPGGRQGLLRRSSLRTAGEEYAPRKEGVARFVRHQEDKHHHRYDRNADGINQGQPLPHHVHEDGDDQTGL